MRRAGIQSSVRLHGCGGSAIPNGHEGRMNQIQELCSIYPLRNIYTWTNLVCSTSLTENVVFVFL